MKRKPKEAPRTRQPCGVFECLQPGEFKAPKLRGKEGEYQYLCLDHIREFNRAWDFFEGWNREQIEAFMHSVVHGHRPTWKMSEQPKFTSEGLRDSFYKMLGERTPKARNPMEPRMGRKEREAFAVLELEPATATAAVKAQYKKLVKKHHPDVNKGNKASEEAFKRITAAYTLLMKTAGSPP